MGQMVGADPEQLDALGNRMSASADRLDSIRGEVTSLLAHSHWDGPDADDFRHTWHHRLSPTLHTAAHATRDASHTLHTNATQQREASSGDGGTGVFVGAGGGDSLLDALHGVADVYHLADMPLTWLGGLGLASATVSTLAAKANLPGWLTTLTVAEADNLPNLGRIAPFLEKVGRGVDGLGVVVSGVDLAYNLAKDPGSAASLKAEADVAFGVATFAVASACPPAGLALFLAQQGVDYWIDHNPEQAQAIQHGVVNAAKVVADTAMTVAHAELQAAERVVDAGKVIVDGGVNAIKGFLHW